MGYFAGIVITLVIYGIIIKQVDAGRCFRYEYMIRTLVILGLYIVCIGLIIIHFRIFSISFSIFLVFLAIPILMFLSLKYTIQRYYDLNLSGWYILLKLIPIFSIFVTFYLYFKKGNIEINEYDKAIDYQKIFKDKYCINIFDEKFIVNNKEYPYERYLNKYIIKVSKHSENDFFREYLFKHYSVDETQVFKVVEIDKDEFTNIIEKLRLIVVKNSFTVKIKNFEIFIRNENFKYTIILDKDTNIISKELIDTFNFPGLYYEDEKYIYYNGIYKNELLKWVKNVA